MVLADQRTVRDRTNRHIQAKQRVRVTQEANRITIQKGERCGAEDDKFSNDLERPVNKRGKVTREKKRKGEGERDRQDARTHALFVLRLPLSPFLQQVIASFPLHKHDLSLSCVLFPSLTVTQSGGGEIRSIARADRKGTKKREPHKGAPQR